MNTADRGAQKGRLSDIVNHSGQNETRPGLQTRQCRAKADIRRRVREFTQGGTKQTRIKLGPDVDYQPRADFFAFPSGPLVPGLLLILSPDFCGHNRHPPSDLVGGEIEWNVVDLFPHLETG